jgi:hypothetical protein
LPYRNLSLNLSLNHGSREGSHLASYRWPIIIPRQFGNYLFKETFEAELWLLNDSPNQVAATDVTATLQLPNHPPIDLLTWQCPPSQANENCQGPSVRLKLPSLEDGPVLLSLRGPAGAGIDSYYYLLYRSNRPAEGKWKPGTLNV